MIKKQIVITYSEWCAFSATRSGAPLKSRQDIYPLLRSAEFDTLFDPNKGQISVEEFSVWHKNNAQKLNRMRPELPIGWTTKIINVYLKTRVYVAGYGRPNLQEVIHPPIDNGLWKGIENRFRECSDILSLIHVARKIKDINTYEKYSKIIEGCRLVAQQLGCKLIEVDQLWLGTEIG